MDTRSPIPFPLQRRAAVEHRKPVVIEPMAVGGNDGRSDAGCVWLLLTLSILSVTAHLLIALIWRA